MSELDVFAFDWLGDTLFNVVLFNLALVGPASFAAGHALAITWRPWKILLFYRDRKSTRLNSSHT